MPGCVPGGGMVTPGMAYDNYNLIYDVHDNTIKTCFIVLKQVELSAGLKWAVIILSCPC
jgi:hypothetical protein